MLFAFGHNDGAGQDILEVSEPCLLICHCGFVLASDKSQVLIDRCWIMLSVGRLWPVEGVIAPMPLLIPLALIDGPFVSYHIREVSLGQAEDPIHAVKDCILSVKDEVKAFVIPMLEPVRLGCHIDPISFQELQWDA